MSTMTEDREVPTGPPPTFGDPEQAFAWVPVTQAAPAPEPAEDTEARSEAPDAPRSHRKHIGAIGAAGGVVGGVALWQAYGVLGLLAAGGAAAGLIAAPVAAYALYKRRGRNRSVWGRSRRSQRTNGRNTMSRLGSAGLGKGRGLKLGGGRGGPKLGKGGGPKLGGRGKGLLSGKSPKLGGGKSGLGLGRGKTPKLGGKSGKLLGGGRGSGLGGKTRSNRKGSGLGLPGGKSRRSTTANRSGGLTGRAGRGGLNLGARGGRAARGAVGRWAKSTGGGAGIVGRKAAAAARRRAANAAQRAANTRAGRRASKAIQAARQAHAESIGKSPFAKWRAATRAAYAQMPKYGRPYTNWAMGAGAGVLALLALLEQRFKAWKAKRNPPPAEATESTGRTSSESTSSNRSSTGSGFRWASSTVHDSDEYENRYRRPDGGKQFTPPPQPWQKPPTIRVEVIREEPVPPKALTAPLRALGPGPAETGRKEPPMHSKFPLLNAAMEFSAVAAKYKPPSAHDLAHEFDLLPEVMANFAAGLRHYAQRINAEEPVEQPVNDALFELFNTISKLSQPAEEIGPLHRQVHAHDIAREEAPRRNEARWNPRQ